MDSTGAMARTPRGRTMRRSAYATVPNSPAHVVSYGSALPSSSSSGGAPRPPSAPQGKPAPLSAAKDLLKTPKHSYHLRRPIGGASASRSRSEEPKSMEEVLPIVHMDSTPSSAANAQGRGVRIALYGLLNTTICIPVMISFAQIIFRDPAFQPYMSDLIKLVLTSAAIHQLCFTISSTLPFAVGQVQDAGLIFLSAMASSIVQALRAKENEHFSMVEVIATTLFTLAASTALLGVALIITGKLKFASFVQYLPMPVVGGYLAFIGFYCLEAGLSMMSGKTIKDPTDWVQLATMESLTLVIPGVVTGLAVFYMLSHSNHVAILPGCMFAILILFYLVLLVGDISLEEARDAGWVSPPPAAPRSIVEIYQFYDFQLMDMRYLLPQLPTWVAMYFVVAFSSSLDVAAVEMALGQPLDHNHELQTVGWSNLVSGCTGGFTGSYIFSQTIFTMRAKLDSRLNGMLIVLFEVAIVLLPVSVIAYVPKMFFGALQTLIACDLMIEWMWHARHKMLPSEYVIVWLTFLVMNVSNLEVGIVLGIVVAAFNFIWSYIAVASVKRVMKRSRVERNLHERELLQRERLSIVTLELDGIIFFGSSVTMMEEVRKHVLVNAHEAPPAAPVSSSTTIHGLYASPPLPSRHQHHSQTNDDDALMTLESSRHANTNPQHHAPAFHSSGSVATLHAVRTRFFILDFERVRGVDATAVRSCFHVTKQLLAQHGIVLVFANVPPQIETLLRVHEVIVDSKEQEADDADTIGSLMFATVDKALEWCEDEILVAEGILPLSESTPRDAVCSMELLDDLLPRREDEQAATLTKEIGELYIEPIIKQAGECAYRAGEPVTGTYFIGYGKVDVYLPSSVYEGLGPGFSGRKRIVRVCQGGMVGASELILNARHTFTAEAKATTFLFYLSKTKYRLMQQQHPRIAARFQQAMLQTMARSVMESNIADD